MTVPKLRDSEADLRLQHTFVGDDGVGAIDLWSNPQGVDLVKGVAQAHHAVLTPEEPMQRQPRLHFRAAALQSTGNVDGCSGDGNTLIRQFSE